MKIIARIARTELATLFYSPIAWFILVVFSFLTASGFAGSMEGAILSWADPNPGTDNYSVSFYFFLGDYGFLGKIVQNLYIYIPLLTMGLISRETSSGSIKLLYSSPVTSGHIVIGKYLASIIFGLCLMIVPVFSVVYGSCVIPSFDWAPVIVGLLGLYLLICTYCAVGLFMSSLTNYQVVAAIGTLTLLAALRFIGNVWQEYDFMRELTYWLSINGRTANMLNGIVRSEDVVYFIAVTALFITFTVLKIAFGRKTISRTLRAASYLGVFAAVMLVGYATSRQGMVTVWDATRTKLNSLTQNSRQVLDALTGPVTVTNYVNLVDNVSFSYMPMRMKMNQSIFDPYCLAKPDLKVKYVYYYDNAVNGLSRNPKFADKTLEELRDHMAMLAKVNINLFKTPEQIREIVDLSGEGNTFVRIVETQDGRQAYIRDFYDMQRVPSESEITAALKKMIATPPTVAFITGNGEREITRPGDRDYSDFSIEKYSRGALINQGFDVCEVDLSRGEKIPEEINIVVIADMKTPFTEEGLAQIDTYLARGGNMFILTDIGRQEVINPFLAWFGIRAEEYRLAQPFADFVPDLILSKATEAAGKLTFGFEKIFPKKDLRVSMPGCVALTPVDGGSGFDLIPLLQTNEQGAWIEKEQTDMTEGEITCDQAAGEIEQTYITAYAAQRRIDGKEQRIIVCGDSDCMSNAELKIGREGYKSGNFQMIIESFRWLSGGEFPIDTHRPDCPDDKVSAGTGAILPMKIIFIVILPAIMLLTGGGLWFFRRRN